jgi:hypothetical protein
MSGNFERALWVVTQNSKVSHLGEAINNNNINFMTRLNAGLKML